MAWVGCSGAMQTQTKGTDFERAVAERTNVILLGDGLGDVTMAEGIAHDNVLKVTARQRRKSR
jgi:hypothetical protein